MSFAGPASAAKLASLDPILAPEKSAHWASPLPGKHCERMLILRVACLDCFVRLGRLWAQGRVPAAAAVDQGAGHGGDPALFFQGTCGAPAIQSVAVGQERRRQRGFERAIAAAHCCQGRRFSCRT